MIDIRLYDPTAIMNVLGCLLQDPKILSQIDKYKIEPEDFDGNFTKAVFMAISNLHKSGANTIGILEVEGYLSQSSGIYKIFKDNKGQEYLNDALQIANLDNFVYYYTRMKKFSALRDLEKDYSIKKVYDESITDPKKVREMLAKFDDYSIKDIFDTVLAKFSQVEAKYVGSMSGSSGVIVDGMEVLKAELSQVPEIGYPLQGKLLNTILRGARKRKYYIRSSPSGVGKSRSALGDACNLAYPKRYDKKTKEWVISGHSQKVLYITTEMEVDELQTMVWAYLADVNEEKILYSNYEGDEEERVEEAIKICHEHRNNFFWEHIPDPTIEGLSARIRNQVRNNKVDHVFYDYIFSSPSLLKEMHGEGVREDVILAMLSTRLKDLANELDIFVSTSTQLNASWEDQPKHGVRNQNLLRGQFGPVNSLSVYQRGRKCG